MTKTSEGLQIHIHLADGSVARFYQEGEAEMQQILGSIIPARVFTQPSLLIGGAYSSSIYPLHAVTHLVFIHANLPSWADINEDAEIVEIGREEFLAAANPPPDKLQPRARELQEGETLSGYGRFALHGGGKIYVRVATRVAARLERRHFVHRVFQAPYFHVRREGGAILINTANLLGLSLFPGPPDLPATAWPAHHMAE